MMNPRRAKFLALLPKHAYKVKPAAIEAGYSEQYADKQGKILYNVAMKEYAKEMALRSSENVGLPTRQERKTLAEMLGLSSEEVFDALRNIALNSKDLTSALKVLKPLSKDLGADLSEEDNAKVVVPVLNIGVRERETATVLDNRQDMAMLSHEDDNMDFATLIVPSDSEALEASEEDEAVYER